MKRDMDLIRRIVLAVQDLPLGKGKQIPSFAVVFRLTWAGHEFADSIRDDTLWKKAKDHVLKPSASWTFATLGEFLKAGIRAQLDLPG